MICVRSKHEKTGRAAKSRRPTLSLFTSGGSSSLDELAFHIIYSCPSGRVFIIKCCVVVANDVHGDAVACPVRTQGEPSRRFMSLARPHTSGWVM
eukprot:scaffold97079_cov51-Attheya_sp.AAC.1